MRGNIFTAFKKSLAKKYAAFEKAFQNFLFGSAALTQTFIAVGRRVDMESTPTIITQIRQKSEREAIKVFA